MNIFHLPDLGEGLADAEIREWHVNVGDVVKVDQPLVCMETAKAVVEVPSPQAGKIKKLYGNLNDVINTGAPLVAFETDETEETEESAAELRQDGGCVVGSLEESNQYLDEADVIIGFARQDRGENIKAMPAVRALAQQLHVDLHNVQASGPQGQITADDVKKMAVGTEKLHGVRRTMAIAMTQSQQAVVPVTIVEDVDVSNLPANSDMTACLLLAIVAGVKAEPAINAWYDGKTMERRLFNEVNVGLAMDTAAGLFVPVLKNIAHASIPDLRHAIDTFKKSVSARTVSPSDLQGATITLSNFGMIAGRYATPIVVPPTVAILGCGKMRDEVVVRNGEMVIRRIIPLSLTFDHRAVTGGEATRFLAALIQHLERGEVVN